MKGYERAADAPFADVDGKQRDQIRVTWWREPDAPIPRDRRTVFGHYWNVPPSAGNPLYAPPSPSGTPELREWQRQHAPAVSASHIAQVPAEVESICVDYSGVAESGQGPCIGAYRWPEHQIAWGKR